ncbi:MAG TPA: PepSY domain-containing protein [Rubricoccaceae bacterium]|jgi:hypothetical protein
MSRLILAAAVALVAGPAFAQKAQPQSPLELGADPVLEMSADGVSYANGRPAMLAGLNLYVSPGSVEDMARQALAQTSGTLGFAAAAVSGLEVTESFTGQAGTVVRFRQTVQGVPVWGAETLVNLDLNKRAQLVVNGVRTDVELADVTPALPASAAREAALAHLGASGTLDVDTATLIVWPAVTGARLAYQVRVDAEAPHGDWEVIVDAETGALLRVADRAVYEHGNDDPRPTALPTVESSPLFMANGTGMIFNPDPLTRAGVAYGGGYVDGADANTTQLAAARTAVTIRDVAFDGTTYSLVGPWAEIREIEAPVKGLFPSTTGDWSFTRDADGFEAATTYWHIDNYMRYVNVTLGSTARPDAYTTGVRFDPHGQSGADNSRYQGGAQNLAFGEGCVDDAEDADVIIHELGHGLHDFLTTISQGDGLSEGLGDYAAVSYSRSLGLLQPTNAAYNWVFKWDGHNECWPGRLSSNVGTYPTGVVPHGRGQHWATSNMRIWSAIGGERTDKAVYEGIRLTTGSSTQPQAAAAVMQAATNMGYTFAERNAMYTNYVQQGYTGLTQPVQTAGEALPGSASGELTVASPNPFNGQTAFELVVAEPQHVRVEVLDVLGRQVAVLFDGEVLAGQRYPFSLSAAGLDAGVYVYRAVGERFQASRRVTLAQ